MFESKISKELQSLIVQVNEVARDASEASKQANEAASKLSLEMQLQRELAVADRAQISRLIVLAQRLLENVDKAALGTDRLEKTAEHVAEDLAASIGRADAADADTPGAGADAALRSAGETAAQHAADAHIEERKFS